MRQITWGEYLSFICFILLVYYVLILIVYYRNVLSKFSLRDLGKLNPLNKSKFYNKPVSSTGYINDSISKLLRKASLSSYSKEEIMFGLQQLLSSPEYKELSQPVYKESINQFIVEECNKECSIHLSEEDLSVLWL